MTGTKIIDPTTSGDPRILTWRSALAVAATLGNLVLWQLYGLGDVFVAIGERASTNVAVMWFAASALCALITALVVIMIVLKCLMLGIDALIGDRDAARG